MSTYFISDLHLEESRPDIIGAFFLFLEGIQHDAKALYILGDFFESWIGDDENTALQVNVKQNLKALSDQGCEIFFMHGNRDFLVGNVFAQETGTTLLEDPCLIDLAGEKTLLMHGDSLCTGDIGYMKFRATIRNPAFLAPFLKRSIEERKITAQQLRAMSQANNQNKSNEIMDVTPEEVIRELEDHQVQNMIHGHTHRPMIHKIEANGKAAKRIVLGDWDKEVWYLKIDQHGEYHFKHYPLDEQHPSL